MEQYLVEHVIALEEQKRRLEMEADQCKRELALLKKNVGDGDFLMAQLADRNITVDKYNVTCQYHPIDGSQCDAPATYALSRPPIFVCGQCFDVWATSVELANCLSGVWVEEYKRVREHRRRAEAQRRNAIEAQQREKKRKK